MKIQGYGNENLAKRLKEEKRSKKNIGKEIEGGKEVKEGLTQMKILAKRSKEEKR